MEYSTLDQSKDEVRLITISQRQSIFPLRTASTLEDLIECQLEHYSLQCLSLNEQCKQASSTDNYFRLVWDDTLSSRQEPIQWRYSWGDYIALSYEWGAPEELRSILLNGKIVKIRAQLEGALRVLRNKTPIQAGCKVWVDALSINQRDLRERSREVTRMHRIYKNSRAVIIWLGVAADESSRAMRLIRTLSDSCAMGQDRELGQSLRRQPDLYGPGSWRALSRLIDRSYWSRLWIMQEIALGAGMTSVLCGHDAVTWEQLFAAIITFGKNNIDVVFPLIDKERKEFGLPPSGLQRNRFIHLSEEQMVQCGGIDGQFICMLDLSRKSLATDPKDKVYGLLGLMNPSLASLIEPDYEASLSKVYTGFAKAIIVAGIKFFFLLLNFAHSR